MSNEQDAQEEETGDLKEKKRAETKEKSRTLKKLSKLIRRSSDKETAKEGKVSRKSSQSSADFAQQNDSGAEDHVDGDKESLHEEEATTTTDNVSVIE